MNKRRSLLEGTRLRPKFVVAGILACSLGWSVTSAPAETPVRATGVAEKTEADSGQRSGPADDGAIRPRLTIHVPSVHHLLTEARRSHAGIFGPRVIDIARGLAGASSEGVDPEEAAALLSRVKAWADTALDLAIYAPDREGRARWALSLDWPLKDLHARVEELLRSDAGDTVFADVVVTGLDAGGYAISLASSPLAYLLPSKTGRGSAVVTEPGLVSIAADAEVAAPTQNGEKKGAPLLECRLRLTGTEKDSGATFLSGFSAVTAVTYTTHVDRLGDWVEVMKVDWPPISGMGVKMLLERVKRTFFVPGDAFGAMAFSTMMAPAMLDGMAGFGPQAIMAEPGEMEIVGEAQIGPIARHMGKALCLTLLPGTGFLPMPDIVIQARAKRAKRFVADVRDAVTKANKLYRDREEPEPWHEATVRNRTVFWRDSPSLVPGMIMPLVMRPVVFQTKERDAKGKERDYLVLAWTSTSPKDIVRRWMDQPRHKARRYLPSARKTNGQLWVHWKQLYRWILPYVNLSLSGMGADSFLPSGAEVADRLTDAVVTAKVSYRGLTLTHQGPIPAGVLIVPTLLTSAAAMDQSGDSDLARERIASRRLRVLYHHCKLFRKDQGRWPAEIRELDGYVDFAGHPELLKLQLSSKQWWNELFKGAFKVEEEEETDDADEETSTIDDDLYVIDWGRESWRLGFAPGTLVHLEKLYIDQDGTIHRVVKAKPDTVSKTSPPHDGQGVPEKE